LETDVITDRFENAYKLFVQMTRMHGTALRLTLQEQAGNIKI